MCRNLILVSLKPEGVRVPAQVMESLLDTARFNDDGFAVWCLKTDGTVAYVRTLSMYEYVRSLVLLNEAGANIALLHTHQRAATSGAVALNNVHLWEKSGIVFSHNGYVPKYASYASYLTTAGYAAYRANLTGDSDSKRFFEVNAERLAKSLKRYRADAMLKLFESEGLTGVAMLNNTATGRFAVVGVGKPIHLYIAPDGGMAVISNTEVHGLTGFKVAYCDWVVGQPALAKQKPHLMYRKRRATTAGAGFWGWQSLCCETLCSADAEKRDWLAEEADALLSHWRWGYDLD